MAGRDESLFGEDCIGEQFRPGGGGNEYGPVRVVPSDITLLDDLARFLERLGCEVVKAADSLEVSIPLVPKEKAEHVLGVFLANWRRGKASIG
jgi:hypothetical protein